MAISAKSCVAGSTKWQCWQPFLWWITLWEMSSACSRRAKKGSFYFSWNVGVKPQVYKKSLSNCGMYSWTSEIPYANVQACVVPWCWRQGVARGAWHWSEASAWDLFSCRCSHLLEQPGDLMEGPWGLFPFSDTTLRGWSWMIFSVLCSRGLLYSYSMSVSSRWLTLVQLKNCKWKREQGIFFRNLKYIRGMYRWKPGPFDMVESGKQSVWAAGKMQAGGCDWSLTFQGELKGVCSPQGINTAVTILLCSTCSIFESLP